MAWCLRKSICRKLYISQLSAFGCIGYVHISNKSRTKLNPKVEKCIFNGYSLLERVSESNDQNQQEVQQQQKISVFHGLTRPNISIHRFPRVFISPILAHDPHALLDESPYRDQVARQDGLPRHRISIPVRCSRSAFRTKSKRTESQSRLQATFHQTERQFKKF